MYSIKDVATAHWPHGGFCICHYIWAVNEVTWKNPPQALVQFSCLLCLRMTAVPENDCCTEQKLWVDVTWHFSLSPFCLSLVVAFHVKLRHHSGEQGSSDTVQYGPRNPLWQKITWQRSMVRGMPWQRSIGLHWCSKATASACFCSMGLFNGHSVLYCTIRRNLLCYCPCQTVMLNPPPKVKFQPSIILVACAAAAGGEKVKASEPKELIISFKGSQSVSPDDIFYFLLARPLQLWNAQAGRFVLQWLSLPSAVPTSSKQAPQVSGSSPPRHTSSWTGLGRAWHGSVLRVSCSGREVLEAKICIGSQNTNLPTDLNHMEEKLNHQETYTTVLKATQLATFWVRFFMSN